MSDAATLGEWRDESSPAAPSSTRTASQRAQSCRQRETEADQESQSRLGRWNFCAFV
jgi:hypothetical protein